jgi:hypothetical protein
MKLHEMKSILKKHPGTYPRFDLPTGETIPAHFHLTEVGHVTKNFIDCGGTTRKSEAAVLQTYVADDVEHRLTSERFGAILDLGKAIVPHDDLDVEVEFDCCVISQYPVSDWKVSGDRLDFQLASKHTDCLAKDKCGIDGDCEASACCA